MNDNNIKVVNTNIDDKLFYFYGVKPLEKEFANFEKKVCQYLMESQGMTKSEAFIAWQLFKMNVKLTHIANFPLVVSGADYASIPSQGPQSFPFSNGLPIDNK